ncbi:MAG TPA: efflux RND transporter permease subunit [Cyclobacteriaceae bacterium]|nr:efflux RND transporter permease subunit [Cyclobacteriaceae bacterium]HMV08524.1 efflux RND transporter permease subunit [Cyclobacteriaceae bacterium]HMV90012.1 efflux RND transporter permease subunit [Cyclobacteriaceae bacterium]HMX01297.1 efflux RND transporter permease subunit [Cyclobacteriaceae bacterium]HMX51289.1 efflux RND transporter permease subunit [Cyclobacteriaceae bacterium]
MNLTEISIKRPSVIIVIFAILMLGGAYCYTTLRYELLPPMEVPTLVINTPYPGAAPSEVEQSVTKKIEDVVSGLDRVKSVLSQSYEGVSVIVVEFSIGTDIESKLQEAQRQINNILNTLPEDVESPSISKVSPSDQPILDLMIVSNAGSLETYDLVENEILPQIQQVEGIGETRLIGGQKREIRVNVDKDRLAFYNLPLSQVTSAINLANLDFPTGKVKDRKAQLTVRLSGKFTTTEQIEDLIVASVQGSAVRIKDVASVLDGAGEQQSISRFNGQEGIGISIKKQSEANAVKISEELRAKIAAIEKRYESKGLKIIIADDSSEFTLEAADAVTHDLVIAVVLVAAVMLLFLHSIRDSLIVLVAIPASLLSTFIAMYMFGYSLNLMTLLAMSLVIGILVDDSIVVLENIHRHLHMGKDRVQATLDGRKEIGFSAMAITMVDVVVFLPIAMINTVVGDVLRQYSVTIVVSTLMSLFVCYTITPWLASRFGKVTHLNKANIFHRFLLYFESHIQKLINWYSRQLAWTLSHKIITAIAVIGAFVLTGVIMNMGILGQEMVASGDRGKLLLKLQFDKSTSLTENNLRTLEIENYLRSLPEVKNVFSNIGGASTSGVTASIGSENKTELSVGLVSVAERNSTSAELMLKIRQELESRYAGLEVNSVVVGITKSEEPIQIVLNSENNEDLMLAKTKLESMVKNIPGANDVSVSVEDGNPELMISLDREKMARLGLRVSDVGSVLQNAYAGNTDAKYRTANYEYDINVKLDEFDRNSPDDVANISFANDKGEQIMLTQFATVTASSGPSMLERKNRRTSVTIKSNVLGITSGTLAESINRAVALDPLPASVEMKWTGDIERQDDSFKALGLALATAIVLVYLVMVVLYDSFIYPFVVLFSVPVALIGALIALNLAMSTLSIFTMLGIIMLIGLVLKNGILLVDFTNQRKADGRSTFDALMDAGQSRLRPILMTTIAMVIGMLPIALAEGAGSEWKNGLAIVMIGGLLSSLMLTVFVVPMVYYTVDRVNEKVASTRKQPVLTIQSEETAATIL